MEIRQLKTFQTLAKLLNFNRSAQVLNYSQSAVSTQIKLLEQELGVSLFDRLGKRVRLTEAGQILVQYSQKMLNIEEEILGNVSGWKEPAGSLSIRIPQSIGTYILPSVLMKFQKKFPKIGLDISSCAYHSLQHELKTGLTDLAFLLADSVPFSELKSELLVTVSLVIVSCPGHPLAGKDSLNIRDLGGETILLPKHDCSYKMVFEQILTEEKVDPATFIEANSIEAVKQCVIRGIGVAMIPMMSVMQEITQKKMVILPWEEKLETGIIMIRHKDKWLSPTLRAFMEIFREELIELRIEN